MLQINNKQQSIEMINKLGLNRMPEIFLKEFDEQKINEFLKENPSEYYAVRNRLVAGSKIFNFKIKQKDVVDYCRNLSFFSVNCSSFGFADHQLLTGEIKISSDMSVSISASKNGEYSARDGALNPDYNFSTDIYDKKLTDIDGVDDLIDYIFKYNLLDVIVEFGCYDFKTGINNEKIVIYELRTGY